MAEGIEKALPTIKIGWDADTQDVTVTFDNKQFLCWDFVQAVLLMAAEKAKFTGQMVRAQAMQAQMAQQMLQAQQAEIVRRKLREGN